MRVMVTGGHGFLGRSIVAELGRLGHDVFAPSSLIYDLTKQVDIDNALRAADPDMVIHAAAAVGGIGANVAQPGWFYYANAMMGVQLIEQCRVREVKKVIIIGSACAYPEHADQPMKEHAIWDGYPAPATAPYGIVKRGLLAQGEAYRRQYGFDVTHVIPANLYGPHDHFDGYRTHVVPALIRRFWEATGGPVTVWGTGRPTRDFLFVDDAARGIVAALKYEGSLPINLGSGVETSIRQLAEKLAVIYGNNSKIEWNPFQPDGTSRRLLSTSRAKALLGWAPTVALDEGLQQTVDWFRSTKR